MSKRQDLRSPIHPGGPDVGRVAGAVLLLAAFACTAPAGPDPADAASNTDAGSVIDAGLVADGGLPVDGGDTTDAGSAAADAGCVPARCQADVTCGELDDGCGGMLHCATCPNGMVCGGAGTPNHCAPCAPPVISTDLPDPVIGTDYSAQIIATGYGVQQYTVAAGALPPTLFLSEYGSLYGTPRQHGRFTFDLQVTDACPTPHSERASFVLNVSIPGKGALSVANGLFHSLAVADDHAVYAWGNDQDGELGSDVADPTHARYQPMPVLDLADHPVVDALSVAASERASFALMMNGQVLSWGRNDHGVLGNGTMTSRARAGEVLLADSQPLTGVTAIAAGQEHVLALKSDRTVVAWGRGDYGRLGNGSNDPQPFPVAVTVSSGEPLGDVIALAATVEASAALLSNHHIVTWGRDVHPNARPTALRWPGGQEIDNVVSIVGGSAHFLALTTDGRVIAWGDNEQGELGNGQTIHYDQEPAYVQRSAGVELTDVTMIAAGDRCSFALMNGQVLGWGKNNIGALGDGTYVLSRPYPVVTQNVLGAPLSGVLAIAATRSTGWAFITGQHLVGWGDNSLGKLAMPWGFTTSRNQADYVLIAP